MVPDPGSPTGRRACRSFREQPRSMEKSHLARYRPGFSITQLPSGASNLPDPRSQALVYLQRRVNYSHTAQHAPIESAAKYFTVGIPS